MSELEIVKVLLVEDDEDDFILTRGLFSEMKGRRCQLDWFKSYALGLEAMVRNQHDVCLLDYRLGAKDGIELLREAVEKGCQSPIILLTGLGEHKVDVEAMKAGAADYLVKADLSADSLERSIRYALERKRAAAVAAFEQANLAAFGADVGLALTQRESLSGVLYRCAESMVRYLSVYLAQIWILEPGDNMLHLRASAGAINDIGSSANPLTRLTPSKDITGDGKPTLVNKVKGEPCIPCPDWVQREGIVAYAAYPMMLENRLIGLMSIFSHSPLSPAILQEMGSVAYGIALTVEHKRSEEALDASEVKYRTVVDTLKDVVFQVDQFGHWTSLNPAWKEITGFDAQEVLGTLFVEYIHHDDRQKNSHVFLQLMERKLDYCRYETRFLTKDGKTRWVDVYAQLTMNPDGSILGASGSLTDITERKQSQEEMQKLEAQFRHAQKLESVGQLAAGVAHDFNNILTVIQGYSDLLYARCDGDATMTGPLKQISDASRRASALTKQLLMFSRKQVLQPKVLDLNAVLRNLSNMISRCLGEDIVMRNEYGDGLPALEADAGMLEQIVMNLAVNSRDAMPKGGQLLIKTSVVQIDSAYVLRQPEARVGKTVCLQVTDTGTGMEKKTMEKIFEPFFSTKEVGKGTGLGLATVYGIVKQHQGWIEVTSEVGVGTTFKIFLPASEKTIAPVAEATQPTKVAKGRSETILLVEDEVTLRMWVKEILENFHYRIVEAANGVEALKVWDDENGKIDLLVTDMVMPEGLTGGDLARQLKKRQPGLKVIYTSGYSGEIMNNDANLPKGPFLSKPYPAPELAKLVRECLDTVT